MTPLQRHGSPLTPSPESSTTTRTRKNELAALEARGRRVVASPTLRGFGPRLVAAAAAWQELQMQLSVWKTVTIGRKT